LGSIIVWHSRVSKIEDEQQQLADNLKAKTAFTPPLFKMLNVTLKKLHYEIFEGYLAPADEKLISPLEKNDATEESTYLHSSLSESPYQEFFRYTLAAAGLISGVALLAGGATLIIATTGTFGWELFGHSATFIMPYLSGTMLAVGISQLILSAALFKEGVAQFLNRHMWLKRTLRTVAILGGILLMAVGLAELISGVGIPFGLSTLVLGFQILNFSTGLTTLLSGIFTKRRDPVEAEINAEKEKGNNVGNVYQSTFWGSKLKCTPDIPSIEPKCMRNIREKLTFAPVEVGKPIPTR